MYTDVHQLYYIIILFICRVFNEILFDARERVGGEYSDFRMTVATFELAAIESGVRFDNVAPSTLPDQTIKQKKSMHPSATSAA